MRPSILAVSRVPVVLFLKQPASHLPGRYFLTITVFNIHDADILAFDQKSNLPTCGRTRTTGKRWAVQLKALMGWRSTGFDDHAFAGCFWLRFLTLSNIQPTAAFPAHFPYVFRTPEQAAPKYILNGLLRCYLVILDFSVV